MNPPHKPPPSLPSQAARRNGIDLLAWLLCGWSVLYSLLLPYFPAATPQLQLAIPYAPLVVMLGVSAILLAALREAHVDHQWHYRWACLALLTAQLLNIVAIIDAIKPYVGGAVLSFGSGFAVYVFVYISLLYSIGFFVPFWRFPRIPVLQIWVDTALLMAVVDVVLRLLLPAVVPGWSWNGPLLAAAFRLESTIGLFFWYFRLFLQFGDTSVVPVRLWLLGFACLFVNDALVFWATFMAPRDQELVRAAIPFWTLNQTLWALALYRNRGTPKLWHDADALPSAAFNPTLWQQIARLVLTLSTLVIIGTVGPSWVNVLWFFCAVVSRELLTLLERQRTIDAERAARRELADRHRELAQTNEELLRTQQELFRVNAQLQQHGHYQAEQLERRQVTAAEIAHDMGNILQGVKVTLSLIEAQLEDRQPELIPQLEEYLHAAEVALRMSENLLSTIVAAAQYDAGALRLNLEAITLETLLNDVVEHQRLRTRGRRLQLELAMPATLAQVRADAILLTRALLNIVGNAVKYTADERKDGSGRVTIRGDVEGSRIRLTVEDNGPGIAPETLARLGQPFVRGVEGPAAPAGYGVGLSFARAVVEQHPCGKLTIDSEVGRGTYVTIELEAIEARTASSSRTVGA